MTWHKLTVGDGMLDGEGAMWLVYDDAGVYAGSARYRCNSDAGAVELRDKLNAVDYP